MERKIKADTGKSPEPGTGLRILAALNRRQPVATAFLENMAMIPETEGQWQAESGAKRRFISHREGVRGLNSRVIKGILSDLGRQARNFPMQHSVGATAIRATNWLLRHYRNTKMHARPMTCLYDSVVTLHPVEERFEVLKSHQRLMTDENTWHDHGRTWNYTSEHEFNLAWSTRPDADTQKLLDDPTWHADPSVIRAT